MDDWHPAPAPFNPFYDSLAGKLMQAAAESMEADEFYDTHTRNECAAEIRQRVIDMRKEIAS